MKIRELSTMILKNFQSMENFLKRIWKNWLPAQVREFLLMTQKRILPILCFGNLINLVNQNGTLLGVQVDPAGTLNVLSWQKDIWEIPLIFMLAVKIWYSLTTKTKLHRVKPQMENNFQNIGCIMALLQLIMKKCPSLWEISLL